MKATGIVRRIDETVIIEPSQENPVKSRGFADLVLLLKRHLDVTVTIEPKNKQTEQYVGNANKNN